MVATVAVPSDSHAVSRSAELLSCCRTAVKIAKRQNADHVVSLNNGGATAWWDVEPQSLQLHTSSSNSSPGNQEVLEDGLSLLRTMESELKHLENLVRRRGHTNDPTEEITMSVRRLETDTSELSDLIRTMVPPTARGQRQKHWQILQQWFQSVAQEQGKRLKDILQVRGNVLAEQARRRKLFHASSGAVQNGSHLSAVTMLDNPLYKIPTNPKPVVTAGSGRSDPSSSALQHPSLQPSGAKPKLANGNGSSALSSRPNPYSYYSSAPTMVGGGYGGVRSVGYGGNLSNASTYAGAAHSTGMRQRRPLANNGDSSNDDSGSGTDRMQAQLLLRQQERQTMLRVQEARQAESTLAELGSLFGKMSTLISQQAEVVDKIEDDVEAGQLYVEAGHQEIITLYSIKKGNRALILKVFGLLIFFIIFMRLYRK